MRQHHSRPSKSNVLIIQSDPFVRFNFELSYRCTKQASNNIPCRNVETRQQTHEHIVWHASTKIQQEKLIKYYVRMTDPFLTTPMQSSLMLPNGLSVTWCPDNHDHCVHLRGEPDYKTETCQINTFHQAQPRAAVEKHWRPQSSHSGTSS